MLPALPRTLDDNFISLFITPIFTATAHHPSRLYYAFHVLMTFTNAGTSVSG
jgi:hypothetical protein